MQQTFTLKDLRELNYFLSIKAMKIFYTIQLSQAKYIAAQCLHQCQHVIIFKKFGTIVANVS